MITVAASQPSIGDKWFGEGLDIYEPGEASGPGIPCARLPLDVTTYNSDPLRMGTVWDRAGTSPYTGTVSPTRIALVSMQPEIDVLSQRHESPVMDDAGTIAEIRSALSLQMTEIAATLGVERPTVYSWLNETSNPNPANRAKLHQLYRLALRWDDCSATPIGTAVRQVGPNGRSVLDLLKEPDPNEKLILSRFRGIAEEQRRQRQDSKPSVQEIAAGHGFSTEPIKGHQQEIDLITGKRFGPE